jgi:outer membrane protein OmpU
VIAQKPKLRVAIWAVKVEIGFIPKSDSPDLGPTFDTHEGKDMKKVLLATTILGMTSGFAAAEIAFTGTAAAGFATDRNGDYRGIAQFNLAVAATGETDSGISFGVSSSISSGTDYNFGDFEFDGASDDPFVEEEYALDAEGGTLGAPTIFISGAFGKITVDLDGFDDYAGDEEDNNDVQYTYSVNGFDVGVRADVADNAGTPSVSLSLGYDLSGTKLGFVWAETGSAWEASVGRSFGPLTASLTVDDAEVLTVAAEYSADGITASLEFDSEEAYTVGLGYSANGLSIALETDEENEWEATASYDLGGGLTAVAGTNAAESVYVGAQMKF